MDMNLGLIFAPMLVGSTIIDAGRGRLSMTTAILMAWLVLEMSGLRRTS